MCHKAKLTHYTWLKSGTWMVKVCTKAFCTETEITVSWLLQVSSRSITWNICYATCSIQLPGKGWHMGLTYLLLLSAPMDWLNIKLNWSLIRTKLWKTLEVWLWLHPLPGYTLQQGMSFARPGSGGIQQIRSVLVGNVKFTKWQRSCYDSLSPPWPRHLIY